MVIERKYEEDQSMVINIPSKNICTIPVPGIYHACTYTIIFAPLHV